jgi:hypothetical protein
MMYLALLVGTPHHCPSNRTAQNSVKPHSQLATCLISSVIVKLPFWPCYMTKACERFAKDCLRRADTRRTEQHGMSPLPWFTLRDALTWSPVVFGGSEFVWKSPIKPHRITHQCAFVVVAGSKHRHDDCCRIVRGTYLLTCTQTSNVLQNKVLDVSSLLQPFHQDDERSSTLHIRCKLATEHWFTHCEQGASKNGRYPIHTSLWNPWRV